jgi:hypothetical protein
MNYKIMSNSAVASAKNRRAGIKSTTPIQPQENTTPQQPSGLTLQQVISLIDTRLVKLEKFMNERQETKTTNNIDSNESIPSNMIEEFQQRFLLLAEEINLLKDTVLKLQSYTMDVNRTLLEERINVLSDLGNDGERFLLNQDTIKIMENVENVNTDNEYIKEE